MMADGKEEKRSVADMRLKWILQWGTYVAIALFCAGMILGLMAAQVDLAENYSLQQLFDSILSFDPEGIIAIGIIAVILTPIMRLLVSSSSMIRSDRLMSVVPLIVLILIAVGFIVRTVA